ncbi:MAG TPA: MBG domain-containing protein [Verrucomicrobiae bacterium]|nr:MBG domain-containing protein [Verrucomicrobiae bacterium]
MVGSDPVNVVLGVGLLASANPGVQTIASPATLVLGNVGGQGSGTGTGAGAEFNAPTGTAVDSSFNVYVADTANNRVDEISSLGVQSVLGFTGLSSPAGVAVDSAGDVYVTDPSLNEVVVLPFGGTQSNVPITGLNYPVSVAVDVSNDVFVADTLNSRVVEYSASGVQSTLAFSGTTGLYLPSGVAVDTNGDVYVANAGSNNIVELSATGVQTIVPFTGLNFATAVAVDVSSNIYVVNYGGSNVKKLASGTVSTPAFTGLANPAGIAVDASGNIYVADTAHNRIAEFTGSASVTFAGTAGVPNYTITGAGGTVTNTDTPVFSNLSSRSAAYGSSVTLTGTLSGPGPTYPASGTAITATVDGVLGSGAISGAAGAFSITYNTTGIPVSVTPYTVTYTSAQAGAFAPATDSSTTLTITQATVTVTSGLTVNPVTFGSLSGLDAASLSSNNVVLAGVIAGDVGNVELDTNGYTAAFTETNASSDVPVTVTGLSLSGSAAANYSLVEPTLAGVINQATLTYTATPAGQPYGTANTSFAGTVSGFAYSDNLSSATAGTALFTSTTTTNSAPGSYPITGSGLTASNYVFAQAAGNATALTIGPATLTYVATAANQVYGGATPSLTGTVTGFVNGDTQGSATTGTLAFTTLATSASPVGGYAITGSGLSAANYVFQQAAGNAAALTVGPAPLTYTANPATREYGAPNPTFSGTVGGFVNGDNQDSATTGTLVFSSPAALDSPAGSYAINGSGLSAANYTFAQAAANATALTVTAEGADTDVWLGGGPNTNWSTPANWSLNDFPGSATAVVFNTNAGVGGSPFGLGKGLTGTVNGALYNSVVDAGFGGTISSLTFTNVNPANNWQNILLPGATTLNITGTGGLTVGSGVANIDFGEPADAFVTIGGPTATLNVSNTSARVWVTEGSSTAKNASAILDLSGLGYFNANVSQFWVACSDTEGNVNYPGGVMYLAATNNITAVFSTNTSETSSTAGVAAFVVGDSSSSNGTNIYLYLGQNNTISADTIFTAREKPNPATIAFNPNLPNLNSPIDPPTVTFKGNSANAVSIFSVGDAAANSGTDSCNGTDNFLGGLVNATIATLNVGRAGSNSGGAGDCIGVLSFSAGTISATTCYLGYQPAANTAGKEGTGTINVSTNEAMETSGTLSISGSLIIGQNATPTNATGTLNVTNGTVMANSIVCGATASNSIINLMSGSLYVTNQLGAPGAAVSQLNLSNATIHLNLNGLGSTLPTNIVATNITFMPSSTATITFDTIANVGSTPYVSGTLTFPLISYTGADPIAGLVLGSLPLDYTSGGLIDNTAAQRIDLQVTYTPPPLLVWSGTINGDWDLTTLNWDGGTTAYANPDLVQFDDTAATGNVSVAATVSPTTILVSNNSLNYVFSSGGGAITGPTTLTKEGTASLTYTDSGDSFIGGIVAGQGMLLLDQPNTLPGTLTIGGGANVQSGNNDANGNLPVGAVVDNGGLTFDRSDSPTVGNLISGSGSVTNNGPGTLTLATANTFSGGVTVNNGTLQVASTGSGTTPLGGVAKNIGATTASNVVVNAGATLVGLGTDAFGTYPNAAPGTIYIFGGTVTDTNTSNYRITLPNLTFMGGTLTRDTGNSGSSGEYSLSGAGAPSIVTTLAATSTASIIPGSISLQQNNQATGATLFNVAQGNVTGGATPGVDLLVTALIENYSSEICGIVKTGAGTMELAASNTFTGGVNLSAGTLIISAGGGISPAASNAITNNGVFTYNSTATQTIGGVISGTGTLNQDGTGTLTLTNVNTFSGSTIINGGTLALTGVGSLANSSMTINSGGTLDVSGLNSGSYTMGGTSFTGSGDAAATINGAPGGTVSFGSMPITLNYNGTAPALTISQGTLVFDGNAIIIDGPALAVGSFNGIISGNVSGTFGSVSGTAIGAGMTGTITISGGTFVLTVVNTTTTTLSGGAATPYGSPISITASVSPTPPDAETVVFSTNGTPISTNALTGGAATLAIATLPAGTYSVTAAYGGDANLGPSTSQPLSQVVSQVTLTPTVTVQGSKPYDGNTSALITSRSLSGFVNGDTLSTVNLGSSGVANYSDPNVGSGKTVTITGLALSGSSAGDYVLSSTTTSTTASITAVGVTIASGVTANNKVYDGTNTATLSLANTVVLSGLVGSDSSSVTLATNGYGAVFASTNAGTNISVTVTGLTLTGGDYTNYSLTQPTLSADILPATLTYVATDTNLNYGSTTTNFVGTVTGFVGGDTLLSATAGTLAFTGTNTPTTPVGSYPITGSGLTASNYVFVQAAGNATALTIVSSTPITVSVSQTGSQLTIGWPAPYLGYTLETNSTDIGNPDDWFPYAGSTGTTSETITIDPTQTNVFFRLVQ